MSKFKKGDSVRVTNQDAGRFDEVGVVEGNNSSRANPEYYVRFPNALRLWFILETSLTLADPDVHTVLDEMDAESAPKQPAFMAGERVMVVDTVGDCGGRSGVVTGQEDFDGGDWLVRLDGNDGPIPFMTSELSRNRNPFKDMAEQEIDGDYVRGLASDPVSHPAHYTSHPSGIECIEITRHMGFNTGNAFKYIWRADLKGNAIQDLEKAAFYIRDEIAKRKAAQ